MSTSPGSRPPTEDVPAAIEALRARHGVRPLQPQEEGSALNALPVGVYGFAYAPGHEAVPLFSKKTYHAFEVHKAADGTQFLLGFVGAQEAANIEAGKEGANIRLFPDPWESSQHLVCVPFAHILPPKRMPREDGNPFPFTIT